MQRDYKDEYQKFQSSPSQKKDRAHRNKVRRYALKVKLVRLGDHQDIDHIDGNPRNNNKKNLKVMNRSLNRAKR